MTDKIETALCTIAGELGLSADADTGQIIQKIRELSDAEPDPAKYVPIEAVRDLMNDHQGKMATARESDIETAVNKAVEGGYITPGMRDWATALCRRDPQSFADFVGSAVPAYAGLFTSPFDGKATLTDRPRSFDEAELAICSQLGIEPGTLVKD